MCQVFRDTSRSLCSASLRSGNLVLAAFVSVLAVSAIRGLNRGCGQKEDIALLLRGRVAYLAHDWKYDPLDRAFIERIVSCGGTFFDY